MGNRQGTILTQCHSQMKQKEIKNPQPEPRAVGKDPTSKITKTIIPREEVKINE